MIYSFHKDYNQIWIIDTTKLDKSGEWRTNKYDASYSISHRFAMASCMYKHEENERRLIIFGGTIGQGKGIVGGCTNEIIVFKFNHSSVFLHYSKI